MKHDFERAAAEVARVPVDPGPDQVLTQLRLIRSSELDQTSPEEIRSKTRFVKPVPRGQGRRKLWAAT